MSNLVYFTYIQNSLITDYSNIPDLSDVDTKNALRGKRYSIKNGYMEHKKL